jgi:class 3 adenylate cyclase/tetratricopeptide (TPR) repeat protein
VSECGACGNENPGDARFCSACGTALERACPVCEHAVDPEARFCSNCGAGLTPDVDPGALSAPHDLRRYVPEALLDKIRATGGTGPMRGERRTVTMLFADLVGSTTAAEQLDPEEWAEIVNEAFEHLIAPVYRYEGTLARLQGDAILAFFGAPIAHEDDPVRAVHAALEMLDAIAEPAGQVKRRSGVPIALRVGINTGLVVVGEVGSDLRVEYTALGDAINVAARMEQTAEPGTVRITETTAGLLGGAFVTAPTGPIEVRGRAEPVTTFRVDGVADHDVARPVVPLVGRTRERATMAGVLDRLRAGVGGVVTLVGEAGIGKSRFVAAVREQLGTLTGVAATSEEAGDIAWMEGHARSFDTSVPYAPFRDLANTWLGLRDVDPADIFGRIAAAVERVHGHSDLDTAAYLTHVTGAPLPDEQAHLVASTATAPLHAKTTASIVAYIEAEAARRPLVLVLDDLHWADALSLALAERLIDSTEAAPITLVAALRPVQDQAAWRLVEVAAREAAHRHTSIDLEPLADAEADDLLDGLLGDGLTGDQRRELRARADGNPLFLEELASSLEAEASGVVPTSLAGLLTARLDRLDEQARHVAEVAAIIGQEFDVDALTPLVDDFDVAPHVRDLVRRGVLLERQRRPRPRYAFRHALLHEAAYGTVLRKERRALHGRLARHLETAAPDEPQEVARHHLASGAPTAAFPWLVRAGERAMRVMGVADAIHLFTTALEEASADADPDEVARAHLGLGEAYALVPDLDQSAAAYQSLVAFGEACERPALQVKALNQLGMNVAMLSADFDTANGYLADARSIAQESGDEMGLAEYHMNACFVAAAQGNIDRAIHHDVETARIGRDIGADDVRVAGLTRRALNLVAMASLDEATEALAEARAAAEEAGAEEAVAIVLGDGEALLRHAHGDLDGALEALEAAAPVVDRFGSFQAPMIHHSAARVSLALGRPQTALTWLARAERAAVDNGSGFFVGAVAATHALVDATCLDPSGSRDHRERALAGLAVPMGDFQASTVWADLAFASIESGRWADAEADAALGLEASSSSRFWERPRLLAAAALAALPQDDPDRARRLVEEAREYVRERGMRAFTPLLGYAAGLTERAAGDLVAAERELAASEDDATTMGMRILACDAAARRAEVAAATGHDAAAAEHLSRRDALADLVLADLTDPRLLERLTVRLHGTVAARPEATT